MKKIICGILLFGMLLSLFTACGGTKEENNISPDTDAGTSQTPGTENGSENQTPGSETVGEGGSESVYEDAQAISLNIGSYNIANGKVVGHNFAKLAKDILGAKLDIVGFQEVDQFCNRSGNVDTMKTLSDLTGYQYYYFFKAINLSGNGPDGKGEYGCAVLSKYPIVETERIALETEGKEGRVFGRTTIDVKGQTVNFFVTHLSYEAESIRSKQFLQVNTILSGYDNVILTGDFNISSLGEYKVLENMSAVNTEEHFVYTFPSKRTCIDNIVYSTDDFTFGEPKSLENGNSDHNMLYASCVMRPSSLASDNATLPAQSGADASLLTDGLLNTSAVIGEYVEIDLKKEYDLTSLCVINELSSSKAYKWTAYGSSDNTLSIEKWTKLGEKSGDEVSTAEGYTLNLDSSNVRYIRIYSEGEKSIPVAEIKVFGAISKARNYDLSAKVDITDASGKALDILADRHIDAASDIGKWAEGTAGDYIEIDLKGETLLYALCVATPEGGNYKWAAYAATDKSLPMSEWTLIAEKNDFAPSSQAGETVYLSGNVKDSAYRYIRIYAVGNENGENFELCEVYLYGIHVADLDNLLLDAVITNGKGDLYTILTDGSTEDYEDLGTWAAAVTGPAYGTAGTCYIEVDFGKLCYIDELTVVNLVSSSRVYKWDAYITDDGEKPIGEWTKIGGKTDNGKSTAAGYTLTLPEAAQQTPIRYIRIYGTYHSANCGYHITEISVVGNPA